MAKKDYILNTSEEMDPRDYVGGELPALMDLDAMVAAGLVSESGHEARQAGRRRKPNAKRAKESKSSTAEGSSDSSQGRGRSSDSKGQSGKRF